MSETTTTAVKKIPVTVLTGFLGAGKTTLLDRILREQHGQRYAVIINEFGEAGIDDKLVTAQVDEEIFEMNNGCICCTVRGDLIRTIGVLMKRRDKFDGILIETTGLADPAPVAQTFFADADARDKTRLDSIITVVDAKHIGQQLSDSPEAREQLAFADTIILNKIDAVEDGGAAAEKIIRSVNRFARLLKGERGNVPLDEILDRGAFDLERILSVAPAFISEAEEGHHHHHSHDITSVSLTLDQPLDAERFDRWMMTLLQTQGQDMLRTKGILWVKDEDKRYVFQAVHMMSEGQFTKPWLPDERPESTLVFIGRGLDEAALRHGLANCVA